MHKAGRMAAAEFFRRNKGNIEKVLLEEVYEEKIMITGYTGNYIKPYIKTEHMEKAEEMLNTIVEVKLTEPYNDGMMGELV